ncbi:MAG: rhodanese-like domain-containing protein [Gammaproteobacteria bacterium]|nr:rhodanese-like domain-containing protein [Gammaproteobacteria bacterium]
MRPAIRFACSFFLFLVSAGVLADKPVAPDEVAGATLVDAEQVIELVQNQPDLLLLDSRRAEEFAKGHIEGALNLMDLDMTEQGLAELAQSKQRPLLFYCNGPRCLRSSNAAKLALGWGYTKIYWFRGGWMAWTEKQYPVAY